MTTFRDGKCQAGDMTDLVEIDLARQLSAITRSRPAFSHVLRQVVEQQPGHHNVNAVNRRSSRARFRGKYLSIHILIRLIEL